VKLFVHTNWVRQASLSPRRRKERKGKERGNDKNCRTSSLVVSSRPPIQMPPAALDTIRPFRPVPSRPLFTPLSPFGRVARGSCPPRAPTDPGVHVKCTRLVRLWVAVPHTIGLFHGDTRLRHGVLSVVPTPRPQRGSLLRSTGSGRPFPRFITTMRRSDFLTVFSPHFVSFAWRYLGAPAIRPRSAADAQPTDHPGVCCTGCSRSGLLQGTVRISQVPGKPS
jgi:hypothetical protein